MKSTQQGKKFKWLSPIYLEHVDLMPTIYLYTIFLCLNIALNMHMCTHGWMRKHFITGLKGKGLMILGLYHTFAILCWITVNHRPKPEGLCSYFHIQRKFSVEGGAKSTSQQTASHFNVPFSKGFVKEDISSLGFVNRHVSLDALA